MDKAKFYYLNGNIEYDYKKNPIKPLLDNGRDFEWVETDYVSDYALYLEINDSVSNRTATLNRLLQKEKDFEEAPLRPISSSRPKMYLLRERHFEHPLTEVEKKEIQSLQDDKKILQYRIVQDFIKNKFYAEMLIETDDVIEVKKL